MFTFGEYAVQRTPSQHVDLTPPLRQFAHFATEGAEPGRDRDGNLMPFLNLASRTASAPRSSSVLERERGKANFLQKHNGCNSHDPLSLYADMSSLELGCMNVMAEAEAQGVKRELLLVGIVPQGLDKCE